jgi:hypothetical protein
MARLSEKALESWLPGRPAAADPAIAAVARLRSIVARWRIRRRHAHAAVTRARAPVKRIRALTQWQPTDRHGRSSSKRRGADVPARARGMKHAIAQLCQDCRAARCCRGGKNSRAGFQVKWIRSC